MSQDDTLAAYAGLFDRFAPQVLDELDGLCRPDVRFVDPFHDLVGLEAMRRVFDSMFVAFERPRFLVEDRAMGASKGFILWRFDGCLRRRGTVVSFAGTTTLRFDDTGCVSEHRDHWDAASAIHARLPVLGPAVRWVNRRIARTGA